MPRYFVTPSMWDRDRVELVGPDAHHLVHVLRAQPGDPVTVLDGTGREAVGEVASIQEGGVVVRVATRHERRRLPLAVTLVQAIPKGQRMDWIVEKATELGVSTIVPVRAERCVVQLEGERAEDRRRRWQALAASAARQCRTNWIPEVSPVTGLVDYLHSMIPFGLFLAGSLEGDARPVRAVLSGARADRPDSVGFLIGPEGDLSPLEYRAAREAGAVGVSFGSRVLRVETAAVYGLSLIAYELSCEA